MAIWQIRDADPATRRRIRLYAVANQLTTAQALTALIDLALKVIDLASKEPQP